jgi:hypothetical protein
MTFAAFAEFFSLQARDETRRSIRDNLARAFSDPIESDLGSSSLFLRVFLTRTGIHFAGKRSNADTPPSIAAPRSHRKGGDRRETVERKRSISRDASGCENHYVSLV